MNNFQTNKLKTNQLLFLGPAVLFFGTCVVWPVIESTWISFHRWDGAIDANGAKIADWIGLENYFKLFQDPNFIISIKNNIIWLIVYLLAIPLGLLCALLLNQNIKEMRLVKSLFFFPFVISQAIVGMIFAWIYNPNFGPLVDVWALFGAEPPAILGEPDTVTYGIAIAGLWPQIAYCALIYQAGLTGLSQDQIEAAKLDNAKGFAMLRHIILPQLKAASFIALIVTIIGALRSFDLVAVMTGGGPYGTSRILSYYMFETALSEYGVRKGYGAAIASVLFLITLIVTSAFLWRLYKDEKV